MALFAKRTIDAALAQERLDKQLQLSLRSIGQEFELPSVRNFIADLQSATNITEDQLVPALRQLISQTGDLQSSQVLLSKALDISAGSGADLDSVLNAINKAAIGNYASIGKLGVGFSAAEAKSMGFVNLMQSLDKYAGSAEEQTKTFAGQLQSFKISAGEATETLGQGFLTAASIIATGSDELDVFGKKLEKAATTASDLAVGLSLEFAKEGLGAYLDLAQIGLEGLVGDSNALQRIQKQGNKLTQERILKEKGLYGLSGSVLSELEKQGKTTKRQLTYSEILKKIQADILAREKATTKEKRAQQELDKKKAELSAMFDLDRINLQAALSRKLSAEDELRVKILQKLADGTKAAVDEAQRYADVLKVIEDGRITTGEIEMLSQKWGISTTAVRLYLEQLLKSNDELRKMLGLMDELKNKQLELLRAQVQTSIAEIRPQMNQLQEIILRTNVRESLDRAAPAVKGLQNILAGIPKMAEGGIVNQPTLALIGEAGSEAVVPLDQMGSMGTRIVVNVAGSVISEGELQSVIQDALYNLNRSGAVTQLTNLGR